MKDGKIFFFEPWQAELIQKNYFYITLGLTIIIFIRMYDFSKKYHRKITMMLIVKCGVIYTVLLGLWIVGITVVYFVLVRISFLLSFLMFMCIYLVTRAGERIIENILKK